MLYIVNCCNNNMDMLANTMRKSKGWTNMNTFTLSTSCSSSTTTTPKRDKGKYMWKIYKEYTFVIHTHTHTSCSSRRVGTLKRFAVTISIYITLAQFAVCVWDALLAWSNIILALLMQEVYDKYTNAQCARKLLQTKSLRIRESARRLLQLCHRSTALVRH